MEIKIYNNPENVVRVDDAEVLHFHYGLPGFEELKRWVMVPLEGNEPFFLLHAVDDQSIALIALSKEFIELDEKYRIPDKVVQDLEAEKESDLNVLVIIKINENEKKMTANLKAPVAVNLTNKQGQQVILDDQRLSVNHVIFSA